MAKKINVQRYTGTKEDTARGKDTTPAGRRATAYMQKALEKKKGKK